MNYYKMAIRTVANILLSLTVAFVWHRGYHATALGVLTMLVCVVSDRCQSITTLLGTEAK